MALNLSVPRTRLLVRTVTNERGQVVPVLADANGDPLPRQRRVSMAYDHEGLAEVTVTFGVDGLEILMLPDRMEGGE